MDKLAHDIPSPGRIDLAREPDFALGVLGVRPSRREVAGASAKHFLQRRVMQVLVALARSPNEVVSQNELIGRCWDGLSVSEDAIGRCIGQLRKLAAAWPEPPFAIETIPGVGYRINPRAREAEPEVRAAPERRRWPLAAAAIMALAAAFLGAWWFVVRPAQGSQAVLYPTISVTPFQPADGSPTAKAYAATLTGEVLDAASRYNLVVIRPAQNGARTNSSSAADFQVGGRIVQKGSGRTVTSELVDARHGVVVYSFDTPAPADPKIDVAAEIAGRIAHALDPSKLTNDLSGKLSPSDYTLVARANDAIDRFDMPDTLGLVQALARRHPDDGDLQAAIAITAVFGAQQAPPSDRPALVLLARLSTAKAAELRPNSALLHIARQLLVGGPLSYAQQERELRKAKDLDPNLHVTFNALGELMITVGRTNEGVALITRSIQLEPMSEVVIAGGANDFVEAGAADEANDALQREENLWPDDAEAARHLRYVTAFYLGAP
ncbi:MAG TPA: winged helix-turn-helix domain-containing protein, partial [Caulobacteraceae bacterium]